MPNRYPTIFFALVIAALIRVVTPSLANPLNNDEIAKRLKAAYPEDVKGVVGNMLEFKDGTSLPLDDGRGPKSFETWLSSPDIKDMFQLTYPRGAVGVQPLRNFDPGRARNEAFFVKIYGDCTKPGFSDSLTTITWLPKKSGQKIIVSKRHGAAEHLQAVSNELDALPRQFNQFLIPSAGGFICRNIAGTAQRSGHAYGIAIDIATRHSHYWRWAKGGAVGTSVFHNEIPQDIVDVFEKHGFIWGGRWYHYDTMHFEYRPELLGGD